MAEGYREVNSSGSTRNDSSKAAQGNAATRQHKVHTAAAPGKQAAAQGNKQQQPQQKTNTGSLFNSFEPENNIQSREELC
jgi:hypothetical protein